MPALLALEQSIVITLNQLALSSGFLLATSRFFAIIGIGIIVGFVGLSFIVDWSVIHSSGKRLFFEGAVAGVLVWLLNQVIGLTYFRSRPYVAVDNVQSVIGETLTQKSFPSDHAAIAFALATVIALIEPRAGVWFLALAFLVAIARVVVGVHYPSDIIVGSILGILVALLIHRLFV